MGRIEYRVFVWFFGGKWKMMENLHFSGVSPSISVRPRFCATTLAIAHPVYKEDEKWHAWKFPLLGWPGTTSDTGRVDPAGFGGDGARWSRGAGDDLLVPRPQAPRNESNPRASRRVLVDKLVVVVGLFTHNNDNNDNDIRINLVLITCSRRRFHVTTTTTNATVGPWRTPGPDLAAAGPAASPGNVLDLLSKSSGSLRRRRE